MEKKVIDLRDCKEDVEIILPNKFRWENKQDDKGEYIGIRAIQDEDPFDLVPKSWEDIEKKSDISEDWVDMSLLTSEDALAFLSLIKLRILWHEWVKVLGKYDKEKSHVFTICNCPDGIVRYGLTEGCVGCLSFKEQSHAEKFIECFKDLLEKAKILL